MAEKKQRRGFVAACVSLVNKYLPDAFIFAVILTIAVIIFAIPAVGLASTDKANSFEQFINLIYKGWYGGFWSLLAFAMQMSLVVVTGSILANTPQVKKGLIKLASLPKTPFAAVWLVCFMSIMVAFVNWGAALIVGAILAKEVSRQLKGVHYAILVAAGYIGLGMWHGGFSGSIPLQIAAPFAFKATDGTVIWSTTGIPFSETIFSVYNLVIYALGAIVTPIVMGKMHPKNPEDIVTVDPSVFEGELDTTEKPFDKKGASPAHKMEHSKVLNYIIVALGAIAIIWYFVLMAKNHQAFSMDLNLVNFIFLIISMALYKTPIRTVEAVNAVAGGAAGVMLQFPFYGGIAGVMTYAGGSTGNSLAGVLSNFFISISNDVTYPFFVWLSAGLVNFFVPSGGGQWQVQGPIVMPTAEQFERVTPGKAAMSIAWGDSWTNLIQPFWALPLLAVAKLQARDIMGYCVICLLVVGVCIAIGMFIPI